MRISDSTDETTRHVKNYYREKFPGVGTGFYSDHDWNRLGLALSLVRGDSVLDVGISNGAFLHLLRQEKVKNISGIDIREHSMLDLPSNVDRRIMSATEMDFQDKCFDTVVCMEVIEHLEVKDVERALFHLRRVLRNRLIMTVPYNEPEPVWRHDRPGGHRQSFNDEKLRKLFPTGFAVKVSRGSSVPWMLVVEETNSSNQYIEFATWEKFIRALDSNRRFTFMNLLKRFINHSRQTSSAI